MPESRTRRFQLQRESATRRPRRRVALVVAAIALAGPLTYIAPLWFRIDRFDADLAGSGSDGTTWLLLGSDSRSHLPDGPDARFGTTRDHPDERADIILVVHRSAAGSVSAIGIPRDLQVVRKGAGVGRLGLMLDGGANEIATAVCDSLGIGVDHVSLVRFDDLTELVELAGPITVEAELPTVDRGSGLVLQAGPNELDGDRALAYVRARTIEVQRDGVWLPDAELSARRSQRALEIFGGIASGLNLEWTRPVRTHHVLWSAAGTAHVDSGSGPADLLGLRRIARQLSDDHTTTLPVQMTGPPDIPLAVLNDESLEVLSEFAGSGSSTCPDPSLLAEF